MQESSDDSYESETDSKEDMSFTSDDENEDAVNILGLCLEQEMRKAQRAKQEGK